MRIRTDLTDGILVLACRGTMTLGAGADELGDAFELGLREGGASGIVLDLTKLSYLDSAGVGAVVACAKRAAASGLVMKVALASEGPVRKIFWITQLERNFEIFDDVASAISSFK